MSQQYKKQKEKKEARSPKTEPPVFTFKTTTGTWSITKVQLHKLRDQFPSVHVDIELEGIGNWLDAHPDRRKAPAAMWVWLRQRMTAKAGEKAQHGQTAPACYADGFFHAELPTDATPEQAAALLATESDQ